MRTRPLGLLWLVLVVAGLGTAGPGHAADITFDLPVACEMGVLCTIQKYVDHDPGPGRVDYGCGRLSLDGDTGTDFRVPDYPAMERGVAVIASATFIRISRGSVLPGYPDCTGCIPWSIVSALESRSNPRSTWKGSQP